MDCILIVSLAILAVICAGIVWCRTSEKKMWNGGVCQLCGSKFEYYDTDSQGGRGYKCQCEDLSNRYRCWISYRVDK